MFTSQNQSKKCAFSEKFLQIIWNENLLLPDLHCLSGLSLKIIRPGIWNTGPGPDFKDAAVLLNNRLVRGDVEIHCTSGDWFQHRHHRDPLYRNVILHAVWEDDGREAFLPESNHRTIPTMLLSTAVLPDWQRLLSDAEEYNYSYARKIPPGACSMRWMMTDDGKITGLLLQAARSRLQRKIRRLQKRCAELGTGQALYEAVFDALGYQQNRENFQALARALPLSLLHRENFSAEDLPAVFLGTAGLIPDLSGRGVLPGAAPRLRAFWDAWWRTGLPRLPLDWKLAGCRPYNHPVRRIAAGFLWLLHCRFQPENWLEALFREDCVRQRLTREIQLSFQGDSFWNSTMNFARNVPPAALLGSSRLLDLLGNIFIPFTMAGTADPERWENLWKLYCSLPPGQSNHLVKEAVHRFLIPPGRSRDILKKNCLQQGLLELYQNFCLALHHDCRQCPFCHSSGTAELSEAPTTIHIQTQGFENGSRKKQAESEVRPVP